MIDIKSTSSNINCEFHFKGIALDGHLKDEDVNLASSTLLGDGKTSNDAMGIVISYSIRVKVNCGTLGGELVTDVPFKLMTPAPGNSNFIVFDFHMRLIISIYKIL